MGSEPRAGCERGAKDLNGSTEGYSFVGVYRSPRLYACSTLLLHALHVNALFVVAFV